jgi:NitT/TauT family transport system permease protein
MSGAPAPVVAAPKRGFAAYLPHEVLAVIAAFVLWEVLVDFLGLPRVVLPSPSLVFEELIGNVNYYLVQSWHTLYNTLTAFVLAVLFGVAMAIGIVYSRFLERTVYALLVALNNVPKVALAPLFVIWLGTGSASKIGMAFLIAIFAIVIDAVLGLRSLDPDLVDLGRSMRGSALKLLVKIRFPNALPSIFAGMKVALSLALVGEIVGEFVAAQRGLGFVILSAQGLFRTDRVFAAILILAAMGTILYYAMEYAERRVLPWHASHRGQRAR